MRGYLLEQAYQGHPVMWIGKIFWSFPYFFQINTFKIMSVISIKNYHEYFTEKLQDNKSVQGVKCYDLFISHSSKDRELVRSVVTKANNQGFLDFFENLHFIVCAIMVIMVCIN